LTEPKSPTTGSEKFLLAVQNQFVAEMGSKLTFSDYQKTLAQHLFLKVDAILKDFEAKRLSSGDEKKSPYIWENINMRKLSLDSVHRVHLGLDALIPNHIHPVPYFNGKEKKYDLDLRIGYKGKSYYRTEVAVERPVKTLYELVYETDEFAPIKQSINNDVESYEFKITQPFNRGEIIGGFGYIIYEDPKKNILVLVPEKDFLKSKAEAKSETFWKKWPVEMRMKTLVHRTTDYLDIDPRKVNSNSYFYVENQEIEELDDNHARNEINNNANGKIIDIDAEPSKDAEKEDKKEPEPTEQKVNNESKQAEEPDF
jgi:recombination protein RecT